MFKKNHFVFGLGIGILIPILLFGFIWLVNFLLFQIGVAKYYFDLESHILVSFFGNLFSMRYYFINLKSEKTGRGILLVTFALVLIFFAFHKYLFVT
jgi:hypothetical protein